MQTWRLLGYLGLLPFASALIIASMKTGFEEAARQAFIAYSAVILSFIAGSLWRLDDQYKHQQLFSNLLSLIAFSSLLLSNTYALSILIISYVITLLFEIKIAPHSNPTYMNMRLNLTLIVVSMHFVALTLW